MKTWIVLNAITVAIFVVWIAPGNSAAQLWSLDAYAGRTNYDLLPSSVSSSTGVLGVRYNRDYRFFRAALGLPLTGTDVTWGVVGLGDRLAIRRGRYLMGADASVVAHAQRDPVANAAGQGVLAEVLPTVSVSLGTGVVEFQSGPRAYASRLGDAGRTRTLWATNLRGGFQAGEQVWLEGDVQHDRNRANEAYTRVGFSVAAAVGPVVLQGSLGKWVDGVEASGPEWNAAMSIPFRSGISFFAMAGHESFNPQFLSSPRTSWGAGIRFQIGATRPPAPVLAEVSSDGAVIRIPVSEMAQQPSIAGDFTGWVPVPMERRGNEWRYIVNERAGVYRFAFRSADGEWFVPESIPNRTDDGMGGWVAVLVVP